MKPPSIQTEYASCLPHIVLICRTRSDCVGEVRRKKKRGLLERRINEYLAVFSRVVEGIAVLLLQHG